MERWNVSKVPQLADGLPEDDAPLSIEEAHAYRTCRMCTLSKSQQVGRATCSETLAARLMTRSTYPFDIVPVEVHIDSDWSEDKEDRNFASCGVVCFNCVPMCGMGDSKDSSPYHMWRL
eukprot:6150584-Amphidinium_carterae.1